jgi:Ca-activated chloride channel homolog
MKTKILILITLAIAYFSFIQNRTIRGKVVADDDGSPIPGVSITLKNSTTGTVTDESGNFKLEVPINAKTLVFSFIGMVSQEIKIGQKESLFVKMKAEESKLEELVVTGYGINNSNSQIGASPSVKIRDYTSIQADNYTSRVIQGRAAGVQIPESNAAKHFKGKDKYGEYDEITNGEEYSKLIENTFQDVKKEALSTFSIDVDRAGYSNVRRMLGDGIIPPKDAVRIEEMINYFDYQYPQPTENEPVSISAEYADSPWNPGLKLLKVGIQAKTIPTDNLPASNLVFLIDVSGSMQDQNKLPLVKKGFGLLVDQLRPQDKVAIVVYAGAAGMVLSPTSGQEKTKIKDALNNLTAGGSTAGGEGIKLAYKLANENFVKGGNNRVIMASDGDFNVGVSSEDDLKRLIEEKRESGVFLSIMGFGLGNYKDNKMETLADKGNGNYAYINNIQEAEKVFVKEFGGTLFTVAKDVKLQLEFNPKFVSAYRLVGYENRMLQNEDFNDDRKDAGDMGSGHTVTAIYEIIPAGVKSDYLKSVDKLKYQENEKQDVYAGLESKEIVTVKLRYKSPESKKSMLMEKAVMDQGMEFEKTTENFKLAAAIAEFGLILRDSEFKGGANYEQVIEIAKKAKGQDEEGYRAEFIKLVKLAKLLDKKELTDKGK